MSNTEEVSEPAAVIDAERLDALIARERGQYAAAHRRSQRAFADSGRHLLGGVPMTFSKISWLRPRKLPQWDQ